MYIIIWDFEFSRMASVARYIFLEFYDLDLSEVHMLLPDANPLVSKTTFFVLPNVIHFLRRLSKSLNLI